MSTIIIKTGQKEQEVSKVFKISTCIQRNAIKCNQMNLRRKYYIKLFIKNIISNCYQHVT